MRLFTTRSSASVGRTAPLSSAVSTTLPIAVPSAARHPGLRRRLAASAARPSACSAHAPAAVTTTESAAPMPAMTHHRTAANDAHYFSVAMDDKVRILRRDVGDRARMVLSGRMADVCAALERMSRAEAISCAV